MIPRLQAEDMLAAAHSTAIGSGHMKAEDVRDAIRRLETAANGGRRKLRRPVKGDRGALAGMGIGVRKVSRAG